MYEKYVDKMVYELYGLSDEEVALVEGWDVSTDDELGYNIHIKE